MSIQEIVTDEEVQQFFVDVKAGRDVLQRTLLKCAAGWKSEVTAIAIVRSLGLVDDAEWELTEKGHQYLYRSFPK